MEMSNGNNVMRDLIRELIPEEDVQKAIRETVSEVVLEQITSYTIKEVVREVIMKFVREKGEAYLRETVEKIVNGPVRLDDGWGNVKEMGSFEDYARKSLRDQCMSQWGMERKLREMVDAKLKKIAQDIVGRHIKEDLQNEVIAELVNEVNDKK